MCRRRFIRWIISGFIWSVAMKTKIKSQQHFAQTFRTLTNVSETILIDFYFKEFFFTNSTEGCASDLLHWRIFRNGLLFHFILSTRCKVEICPELTLDVPRVGEKHKSPISENDWFSEVGICCRLIKIHSNNNPSKILAYGTDWSIMN